MGKVSYKKTLIFIILFLISLISPLYTLPNNSHAHTTINSSHELFSIWDENNPSINGEISFNSSSSSEWGNASIYSLLD
ncbi:MAG: hypothetical protein U9O98_00270, partial [Asgard group archaeon]|nr:hypothetical protein [Asgard group archaeon]